MPRSFWWKYNLHYVYNLYATGIRFIYMNGCRHTFYVISFNKATHHFTMPYSIYNRNLYYVLNGCYYGYTTKLTRTNLYQLYLYTHFTWNAWIIWECTIKYTRVRVQYNIVQLYLHVKHAKKWRETSSKVKSDSKLYTPFACIIIYAVSSAHCTIRGRTASKIHNLRVSHILLVVRWNNYTKEQLLLEYSYFQFSIYLSYCHRFAVMILPYVW